MRAIGIRVGGGRLPSRMVGRAPLVSSAQCSVRNASSRRPKQESSATFSQSDEHLHTELSDSSVYMELQWSEDWVAYL